MNKLALALGIGAALVVSACSGSESPTPGNLAVRNSAVTSARAVMVKVAGPVVAVAAPSGTGYHVFGKAVGASGDTTMIIVVAPKGTTLGTGDLATIQVPDTHKAGSYTVTAIQASNASNALVAGGFTLSVGQP